MLFVLPLNYRSFVAHSIVAGPLPARQHSENVTLIAALKKARPPAPHTLSTVTLFQLHEDKSGDGDDITEPWYEEACRNSGPVRFSLSPFFLERLMVRIGREGHNKGWG